MIPCRDGKERANPCRLLRATVLALFVLTAASVQAQSNCSASGASKIYWTDLVNHRIQRAQVDGTNVEELVTSEMTPSDIALDLAGGRMYWPNQTLSEIRRANLDGTGAEDLGVGPDFPVDLDLAGDKVYWTASGANKIQRANLNGTGVEDLVTGVEVAGGIAVDSAGGKLYWVSAVADSIRRANLDGTEVEELVATPLGRDLELDVASGKMYWVDSVRDKVKRADLDGSNVEDVLATGVNDPHGLALDLAGGKMYWTDRGTGKIRRANLDGTNVEDVLTGLEAPVGIAVPDCMRNVAFVEGGWVNQDTQGEGMLFDFSPTLDLVFVAWFTFTLEGEEPGDMLPMDIGASGQRWMTALLDVDGTTLTGPLRARRGGAFDAPPRQVEDNPEVGNITIELLACDKMRVEYAVDTAAVSGDFEMIPLEKLVNPDEFECELGNSGG